MVYFDELLPKYNDNSSITRSEFNALVQAVKQLSNPQGGFGFSGGDIGLSQFDKTLAVPQWFGVKIETPNIPPHSVFTIKENAVGTVYPTVIEVEKCRDGWRNALLTNGATGIVGVSGNARIIDWFMPVRLRVSATEPTPIPGFACGPVNDTFEVAANSTGLICLAVDSDETFAMCIAAQPGPRFLCKPTEDINANKKGPAVLWFGPAGSEVKSDPQIIFEPWNRTSSKCGLDKFCEIVEIEGKLYIVPWECETVTTPPVNPATATGVVSDNFDRATGNNFNVGATYPYTAVFGSSLSDFTIVAKSGADHACQLSNNSSGVVLTQPIVTAATLEFQAEIEPFGLKNGDEMGVILSYLDDNSHYDVFGVMGATSLTLKINRRAAGVTTELASATIPKPAGARGWIVGRVNFETGYISGWLRDENMVKSTAIAATYTPNGGTQVGFGTGAMLGTNDVDNFKVEEKHST